MKDIIFKAKEDILPIMLPGMFLFFGLWVFLSIIQKPDLLDISIIIQKLKHYAYTVSDQKKDTVVKGDKKNNLKVNKAKKSSQSLENNTAFKRDEIQDIDGKESFQILEKQKKNFDSGITLLFVFFLVYLIGLSLRSIPVAITEKFCKMLHCTFSCCKDEKDCNDKKCCCKKTGLAKYYYFKGEDFPYSQALNKILEKLLYSENLLSSSISTLFPLENICDKNLYYIYFNFFKVTLCAESTNTFNFTQSLETRVRLFAGLFWACVVNLFLFGCSILFLLESWFHFVIFAAIILLTFIYFFFLNKYLYRAVSWTLLCTYIIAMLIGSANYLPELIIFLFIILVLLVIIIKQFSWVRGQEVFHVFLSYLSKLIFRHNKDRQYPVPQRETNAPIF
jgi:hypothetical protein